MIKVLVVDDSALVRKLFGRVLLAESGFEVVFARSGVEALEQLETFKPHVITLDVNMPHMNGLQCLDRIMVQRPSPVVMVSTLTAEGAETTLDALRLGAVDFVSKPSGAVSLHIADFAPTLLQKIRAAASAKLPSSKRLKERVQLRSGGMPTSQSVIAKRAASVRDTSTPVSSTRLSARLASAHATVGGLGTKAEAAFGDGIVLVGTSTGGPPALEALLLPLPKNFPWPILVAQHMPATFTGTLAKRLDSICSIKVVEASKPMLLQAGCVYIGRGDADLVVSRRAAGLVAMAAPAKSNYPWHPSADRLVRSAMEQMAPSQLIGILMTGMGDDGAAAMTELRAKGGRTIAEAEETAIVWGMPGELVQAGGADWVVPLPKIAKQLQKLVPRHAAST